MNGGKREGFPDKKGFPWNSKEKGPLNGGNISFGGEGSLLRL